MSIIQENRSRGKFLWRAAASGFGVGYLPLCPGTFGSMLALPVWYLGGGTGIAHYGILAAVILVSIPAAGSVIRETGGKDPPSVVIDEVAGMLLAATGITWNWKNAILLFLLFRFFDIFKLGPAAWADAREGAFYVVADDLVAGLFAHLSFRGILWAIG